MGLLSTKSNNRFVPRANPRMIFRGLKFLRAPVSTPASIKGITPSETSSLCTDRKSIRLNSSHLVMSYAVFCLDRKSTRLNSSHLVISYAVFCLKKKRRHFHLAAYRQSSVVWSGLFRAINPFVAIDDLQNAALVGAVTKIDTFFFFLRIRRPPKSTLFPSRPPFR